MLLLAIDTSGKEGSIALADGDAGRCNILGMASLEGGAFSAQLVPQIAELLANHNRVKRDIGAFAAVSGPGSFTGLRVGLAAVKALAEVLTRPIAAVSLLEALAAESHEPALAAESHEPALAAMDAGRKEIYLRMPNGEESLFTQEEFLAASKGRTTVTADKSIADLARAAGLNIKEIPRPRSDAVARLGWKKIQSGETVSPEALDANYIRRSDQLFARTDQKPEPGN